MKRNREQSSRETGGPRIDPRTYNIFYLDTRKSTLAELPDIVF